MPTFRQLQASGVKLELATCRPHGSLLQDGQRALGLLEAAGIRVNQYTDKRHRKLAIIDGLILWVWQPQHLIPSR